MAAHARRRRLALALLAALTAVTVALLALRGPAGAARDQRDGGTRPDSAAPADSQPFYDPPCLASRLGLPCR
jgi:hypothetical protein